MSPYIKAPVSPIEALAQNAAQLRKQAASARQAALDLLKSAAEAAAAAERDEAFATHYDHAAVTLANGGDINIFFDELGGFADAVRKAS